MFYGIHFVVLKCFRAHCVIIDHKDREIDKYKQILSGDSVRLHM